jgi:CheY-like chemotaxis protein
MPEHAQILVADDEPHMRRTLSFVLRRDGLAVEVAEDGDEALARARSLRPRVLIIDANMPGHSGYDVCRRLRQDGSLPIQPHVIMLTGGGQDADRERAQAAGVDEFMTKPFSPSHLLERVRCLLAPL